MKVVSTKTMKCKCKNSYQDKKYGPSVRIFNRGVSKTNSVKWRCTSCGNVIEHSGG